MSRTHHHGSPARAKLLKLCDKYTGWIGEGNYRSAGKRFLKRLQHRYNRRRTMKGDEE